jgi:RNA polymerase sigma factor (sigma-70 family)
VEQDAEVYEKYAEELIRFATFLAGPTDAPDLLCAAVLRTFTSATWPSVVNRRAYLYRAVLNEARMSHRSRVRRFARERRAAPRDISPGAPELRPEVLVAVARLSPRQRAVVFLTYWDDLDPSGVAEVLGISDGSVRRHLARARKSLRRLLDE